VAVKTLGVGGNYATFTAAIAGIATWDTLNVLDAGTYVEAATLAAISKTVEIVNLSTGQVIIRTPVGQPIGSVTGGPVTVTWTGDFDFQIRKGGANIEYHWLLGGAAGNTNKLIFDGCTFTSDYTTAATQVVYQQAGKSHEFRNCKLVGIYDALVTLAAGCKSSVIDGLEIVDVAEFIIAGGASPSFDSFDFRNIWGNVSKAPISGTVAVTGTGGLLTTSRMWGMDGASHMTCGAGAIAIEKSVFSGSRTFAFSATGGISTGTTFRNVEFSGFSVEGVNVSGSALPNLVDYCGASNGCPSPCNSAGSLGTHNQTSDPLFVDYAGHDYHLLAGSPRIDAGTVCMATVDPDGTAIPQGSAPDIGNYEYIDPTPPNPGLYHVESSVLMHATDIGGSAVYPGLHFELVPTNASGAMTDIRRMLLLWALIDRRVETDQLPAELQTADWPDNRGWLADPDAGNRAWLFDRRPLSLAVDEEMRLMLTEDLLWLTAGGYARSYTVTVTHTARSRDVLISVVKPDGTTENVTLNELWTEHVI
jgi:phage gp46-like protein